jgi:hypothetical protein
LAAITISDDEGPDEDGEYDPNEPEEPVARDVEPASADDMLQAVELCGVLRDLLSRIPAGHVDEYIRSQQLHAINSLQRKFVHAPSSLRADATGSRMSFQLTLRDLWRKQQSCEQQPGAAKTPTDMMVIDD